MSFDWSKYTVLVVEDDKDMRMILLDVLTRKNIKTLSADNGSEALKILEEQNVDFVLSDIQMPVLNGVELLKRVRAKNPFIPIVLLATGESQITSDEAKALGAADLISKPFKIKELLLKMQSLIEAQFSQTCL
jgi:CheY-like chemotaxis protein